MTRNTTTALMAAMAAGLLAVPAAASQLHDQRWMHRASYEQVQKAIEAGADVEALHPRHSVMPLVIAAAEGNAGVVRALCEAGADPQRDDHPLRQTPLHLVTTARAAEELFHCGGLVWVFDGRGGTPLHYTAINGRPDVARALIRFGADPNETRGGKSNSPLYMVARQAPHPAVLQVLIEAGGSVNTHGPWGATPLYIAAKLNSPQMVETLLDAGAEPTLRAKHHNMLSADLAMKHNQKVANHPVMARLTVDITTTGEARPTVACGGYVVQAADRRLGDVAEAAPGERSRWPEIARLNGITAEGPHRVGQCLKLP